MSSVQIPKAYFDLEESSFVIHIWGPDNVVNNVRGCILDNVKKNCSTYTLSGLKNKLQMISIDFAI